VQFSTAYAVMARSLGIPTRVAVGFTPGELRNGHFHVSAHDAHAWPEVWLAGMGWTHAFDPTPPADDHPESGGSAVPNEAAIPPPVQPVPAVTDPVTTLPTPEVTAPGAGTGAGTGTGSEAEPGATQTAPPAATPVVAATAPGAGASPGLAAVLAVLALLAAIGAYVAFVLVAKARQRARRRTGAPGDSVQGAWDEALDRLHEARVATDPSRTPLELSRVVPANAPGATRPFRDLARHYTTARYSGSVPTDGDATRAWEAADALTGALDSGLGWRERWRRRLDPGTLRRRHHRARGGAP
jgi:hypothetical protein